MMTLPEVNIWAFDKVENAMSIKEALVSRSEGETKNLRYAVIDLELVYSRYYSRVNC